MNFDYNKVIPIKGDASFRKFYRKKIKKKSSIIVYAEKEKIKNLLNYDSINQLLLKKNVSAPRLLSENFNQNFIEIEDFGKKTLFDILKIKRSNKFKIYKRILVTLIKLQNIKVKKIKLPNNTFVHRDFHVSNLMLKKRVISVIDSQDAVYGNLAYDLASLIDDVRLRTSKNMKEMIYKEYLYLNKKKINIKKFKNDFDILSVLRNLKIIGIFTRLANRDNKKQYLKLIPHAWELIELRIKNNYIFKDLKKNLETNFPKKIRIKK